MYLYTLYTNILTNRKDSSPEITYMDLFTFFLIYEATSEKSQNILEKTECLDINILFHLPIQDEPCLQLQTVLAALRIPDLCRCRETQVAVNFYCLTQARAVEITPLKMKMSLLTLI